MSSESCVTVVVEQENVVETVSVVGLVLSGIFGLLIGAIIGFILFKCFLGKKQCCGLIGAVGSEKKEESRKASKVSLTNEKVINEDLHYSDVKILKRVAESIDDDVQQRKFFLLGDFVKNVAWDKMIFELGKHELIELMRLELAMWEERYICLLLLYRCTLNRLFSSQSVSESQCHNALAQEEKILSAASKRMKDEWEAYIHKLTQFDEQSLIDSFAPFQANYSYIIKNMISEYRGSTQRFIAIISQNSDAERVRDTVDNLLLQTDAIEGFYRENQDEVIESIHSLFQKYGAIIRELVVTFISESGLNHLLSVTCDISLEKLVKTGRISSETKESVKDTLPENFDIAGYEIEDVFSKLHPNFLAHYDSLLHRQEQESENALQSILVAYENQTSPEGFVQSYLSACCEQKLQRMVVLQDVAMGEQAEIMSKLERLSQLQEQKRFEAIRIFCQQLGKNDALSRSELQEVRQDFAKKIDAARGKFFTTCKRNITELWRLYEQHCRRQQEEGNRVDASILQDSVTDNLVSLEGFLHMQTSLSSDDQHIIIQERESLFLLLINQINTFRVKWLHVVENDLTKCQAFLLVKKSTDLVNDTIAEILGIIERLWDERNSMMEYIQETASLSCMKSILEISNEEMCKTLSRRLVKNLVGKTLPEQGEIILLERIENALISEISSRSSLPNLGMVSLGHNERLSRLVKAELDRHDFNTSITEEEIGAALLKRQGRLKTKAQRIAQHTPPPGASVSDIQPLLEQLLLQNQVGRAISSAEFESIRQNLMTSLIRDKTAVETMLTIRKDSDTILLAKFAAACGLKKSEYMSCLNHARNDSPSQGNARSFAQKYMKIWKEASECVESISY